MAPMTRSFSPGGVPASNVVDYYDRRATGEVGLIISEGTVVNRAASSNDPDIPRFFGKKPLLGWKAVIDKVHSDGGVMAPQLWHMGVVAPKNSGWLPPTPFEGPSGYIAPGKIGGVAMTEHDIADTIRERPLQRGQRRARQPRVADSADQAPQQEEAQDQRPYLEEMPDHGSSRPRSSQPVTSSPLLGS